MSAIQEITAIYRSESHRWDSTAVLSARLVSDGNGAVPQPITLYGQCEPDELQPNQTYRFYGRPIVHPKYGPRFEFQTFVRALPHGRAGTIKYLQSAPHIGQAIAATLWDKFAADAVRVLRESPEVATAGVGRHFNLEHAEAAAAYLRTEQKLEACTIALIDLLAGRGFPRSISRQIVSHWGNRGAELIRKNPYLLMAFRGAGFLRCDAMYIDLGLPPAKITRQAFAAWHGMASDTEGHTWYPRVIAEKAISAKVAGIECQPEKAVALAVRGKLLRLRVDEDGRPWLAEEKKAAAEQRIAEFIAASIGETPRWPAVEELEGITSHQAETLTLATTTMIGILAGTPGTGKTFTAAAAAKAILKAGRSLAVTAPTGKAAVRVTEAMAAYGCPARARTIHSLLKVDANSIEGGWSFEHGQDNPLDCQFIIVDEASMIDASLMASLLAARAPGTHILFVGDPNQLPPVGHGAPLRDMIAAGLPYGELTEIRRNSGTIVAACADIRHGRRFAVDLAVDLHSTPPKNLAVIGEMNINGQIEAMLELLAWASREGFDHTWDCQVIVPVNAKSKLSRRDLNLLLQQHLNAGGERAGGNPFLVGDKVVNLKNGFFTLHPNSPQVQDAMDGKVFAANGELGQVVSAAENLTVIKLTSPDRLIKVPRGKAREGEEKGNQTGDDADTPPTGCSWDLGYALSCHKCQGSEFPIAIVMIDEYPGARYVCSREWIYTAISRAKQACFLVGKLATAHDFCRRQALDKRKTFLRELIVEGSKVKHAELFETAMGEL